MSKILNLIFTVLIRPIFKVGFTCVVGHGTCNIFLSHKDRYRTFSWASDELTLTVRASTYSLVFDSRLAARLWPWKFGIRPLHGLRLSQF